MWSYCFQRVYLKAHISFYGFVVVNYLSIYLRMISLFQSLAVKCYNYINRALLKKKEKITNLGTTKP